MLDAGATESGRPYFVMELVKGEPISGYCDKHALSIPERLEVFEQVCQAVQHAHTKGVIHRDLKPSNVLVSEQEGRAFAKVIDFGIAKATSGRLTDKTLLTELHQMIGTPLYMSPEQAEGSADIDTRTDIYSLGVLLYELLTGSTPFESDTLRTAAYAEVQRIIREVDPPRPSARLSESPTTLSDVASARRMDPNKLRRLVRGELDWIAMKALEKERVRRYETANALAIDVHRFLAGQPVVAAPPSNLYRAKKFIRRNRVVVGAGLLVAASLVAGIVGFAWQARIARARAAELEQVSEFQAEMLRQIDPTEAGRLLTEDVQSMFMRAMEKAEISESERTAQVEAFTNDWRQVNATDAARDLIDRTILKPAVEAINRKFTDQPLVAATLREALAVRYEELGLNDAATPLQEQALETRRRILGSEHPDTLSSISDTAILLLYQGKLKESEQYAREALLGRRQVLGDAHLDTIESIEVLGSLLNFQGRLEEAEPLLHEALDKRRHIQGNENRETLAAMGNFGTLLMQQGKLSEAEPYLREGLQLSRRTLGDGDRRTIIAISELADLLQRERKLSEAEVLMREALEQRRRSAGQEHPKTIAAIEDLGQLLQAEGKFVEAEPYLREAEEKFRKVLGDEHVKTVAAVSALGSLLVSENKYADAASLLAPFEPLVRKNYATSDFNRGVLLLGLGEARVGLHQFTNAEGNLVEAHQILKESQRATPKIKLRTSAH